MFILAFVSMITYAQSLTVTGKVLDSEGYEVIGGSVVVKGAAGGAGAGPAAAGTAHGCPVRAARRNSKKELDPACQMQADLCRTAKNWGCRCNKTGHCTPCGTVQAGL